MTSNYAQQAALVIKAIPHLSELPTIIWKRKNLETLRQSNPVKFAEQRKLLEAVLT